MAVAFLAEWASPYEWAAIYRSLGLQVVPGREGEKRPLVDWLEFRNALVPQSQFDRWFDPKTGEHRMLRAMGLLTGACSKALADPETTEGLFFVDLDVKDTANGLTWWNTFIEVHLGGIEPETWRARSGGGGLHIYFLAPKGWVPPTFKAPTVGVDLRGQGGYGVAAPSIHPNGKAYEWIEGFEPWAIPIQMAPVELCEAIDRLRLEHGGNPTGPREHTIPEGVKNAFGRDIDDREHKLQVIAWALVVDLYRDSPIPPTTAVVDGETEKAFARYELTTKSRLAARPGHSNGDLLELEGRGISELRRKVAYALAQWDGKVAEAAKVPKSERESDSGNSSDSTTDSFGARGSDSRAWRSVADYHGEPPERRWLVEGWVARGEVNSLYGGGATGKSLLAFLLAHSMAVGLPWVGLPTVQGSSLFVSCEDDDDELHRRHAAIRLGLGHGIGNPFGPVTVWNRVGHNNLLAIPSPLGLAAGPFMGPLVEALAATNPTLVILDTLADVYGGNEIDRVQVNGFLKTCLGGLIQQRKQAGHDLTVLLLGHPSKSALADGSGFSGSTAWENGVRSRLYLSRPENGGPDERILSRGKANYAGGDDGELPLLWSEGVFIGTSAVGDVERMAKTVRNEVASAWSAGMPYVERRGHPRNLHFALVKRLTLPGQPRELVIAGLRQAIDDGLIYPARTNKKRGWRASDDE